MRKIEREPLSDATIEFLWNRRLRVVKAGDDQPASRTDAQYKEAKRLWKQQENLAFDEIKAKLRDGMAPGHGLCMYCEDSGGCAIDHFRPQNAYPTRAFEWENHLWACFLCNTVYKGTQFPLDARGLPLLLDPTRDNPDEHLTLAPNTGKLMARSAKGETTIQVLGFDRRGHLDKNRAMAWRSVQRLLVDFDDSIRRGDSRAAIEAQKDLCHHPHASVLPVLIETLAKPGGDLLVQEKRCAAILDQYPEIRDWL